MVQNRPLDFNPSIIYHHRIHPGGIPLITAPIYEPASRSHIWSYCPEHRLFEEIRTGEQHNESAVVFRGICPEDVIRHDVNIANLTLSFHNIETLRENRSIERRLSREIYIIQITRTEELQSAYIQDLINRIERARVRCNSLC